MKLNSILALLTVALVASSSFAADPAPAKKAPAKKGAAAGKVIEVGTGDPKDKKNIEATLFDVPEITIKAGQEVTIKFTNRSKTPGMQHNLVITKPGKDKDVANASIAAGPDKGWVAQTSEVLFKTKLLDAGGVDTITVKIDQPGDYPYICTFPGHYPMMKGVLKVTK